MNDKNKNESVELEKDKKIEASDETQPLENESADTTPESENAPENDKKVVSENSPEEDWLDVFEDDADDEIDDNREDENEDSENDADKSKKSDNKASKKRLGKNKKRKSKKKQSFDKKTTRRLISASITCLVIIAAVLVNIISIILTDKYSSLTADITESQSFNLTDDSITIVEGLLKSVTITFLTSKSSYEALDTYCKQASTLINKMAQESDGMITVEYVDLVQNPSYENNYPDDELSTTDVIVTCGDNYYILTAEDMFEFETYSSSYSYIVSSMAEQAVDRAILTVTSDVSTNIALVTDYCVDDYSYFKSLLTSNNYDITEISLVTDDIPDDTDMVIVYAPANDYTEEAITKLEEFLYNDGEYGKNLLYVAYRKQTDTPNIDVMLADFGIALDDGLAFDMDTTRVAGSNYYDGLLCSFATDLYCDNITSDDYPVIVSLSRSMQITDSDIAESLLILSESSGYCPFDAESDSWSMDDAVTGYVTVMAQGTVGTDEATSTVVVSGSTYMFEQSMLGSSFSNSRYILDMFATLNGRDTSLLSLENKVLSEYDLTISVQTAAVTGVIMYAAVPLAILGVGLTVFIIRRHK